MHVAPAVTDLPIAHGTALSPAGAGEKEMHVAPAVTSVPRHSGPPTAAPVERGSPPHGTALRGGSPRATRSTSSSTIRAIAARVSRVPEPRCGVSTTFSSRR